MKFASRVAGSAAVAVLTAVLATGFSPLAESATRTWDAGGGDGLWGTAANWDADTLPVGGDTVIINNGDAVTNNLGSGFLPNGIDLTLSNNSSIGVAGGAFRAAASTITVESGSTLGFGNFWDLGNGTFNFEDGAITNMSNWEQKGTNVFNFELSSTGFTTLNPGTFRFGGGATIADATYRVDLAAYTGTTAPITLVDFTGNAEGMNDATFQGANLLEVVNPGIYSANIAWDDLTDSIVLNFTGGPAPPSPRFDRVDLNGSGDSLFNGSFEDATADVLGNPGSLGGKVTGSNTSFDFGEVNQWTVTDWEPFFEDPNNVVGRYGNSGTLTDDSFYLDTALNIQGNSQGARGMLLNSVDGYRNGMVNTDFLSGLDPKFLNEDAEYKLTVDFNRRVTDTQGDDTAIATVKVTDFVGTATDAGTTDSANAIPGGTVQQVDITALGGVGSTEFEMTLSGADLANASQLNLIVEMVNSQAIGSESTVGQDLLYVAQIVFDNFQLVGYLPGDSDGDFDVDNDDYAAWVASFGDTGLDVEFSQESGDFNGDGSVDAADYTVWRDNYTGDLSGPSLSTSTAVPEPVSMVLLLLGMAPALARARR